MPPLSPLPLSLPHPLWNASAALTLAARNVSNVETNSTTQHLQVVCAWPVSGQYGPGSRVLYYVLIAACVFARKSDWLRNACLAGALLFPAVAALHGIVLAAVHVNGAVDMDVYGAFQLCSIGILAAPVVVRLSRTYFYDPGRNIIFIWTVLILVGLLSLTVEFFRINTTTCPTDDNGIPISPDPNQFKFNTNCGLTCDTTAGPFSPIRGGSANNIYVIPAPSKLTFDTVTLMAAACCVPAILSLISMWNKILKINWKKDFGSSAADANAVIEGTNGATNEKMKNVNEMIRLFLSAVEIPVFGAAIFAILLCGERNFFSHQVDYQTEPIASIGQWAPIVGTGLAVVGSLYLLRPGELKPGVDPERPIIHEPKNHGTPPVHDDGTCSLPASSPSLDSADAIEPVEPIEPVRTATTRTVTTREDLASRISRTATHFSRAPDQGKRRQIAKALTSIGTYIGTAARDRFDDSAFKTGEALDFPEVPGELNRNPNLPQIRNVYNTRPPSVRSGVEGGRASSTAPTVRGTSPSPLRRIDTGILRPERMSSELQNSPVSTPTDVSRGRPPRRRATLEVPSAVHYGHGHTRNNLSISTVGSNASDPASPTIIISSDSMIPPPPVHTPTSNPASPLAQNHPSTPPPT